MELIQINPDGKKLPEYSDYLKNPSKENASELLSELLEQSADMIADKEILVKYVAERPGVEKIGKHGLFSDGDDEIILSQVQKNIAEHQGNVWSHVISLTREDAERLGYTTPEIWRNLIMRHTDDIAKAQNVVFVGMDENGTPKQASVRSTLSFGKIFRITVAGSDTDYSFSHFGNDGKLFVFEAPIDMLSFITLNPKDWKNHSYIAMNGIYESAALKALENHSDLRSVYLCTDNDEGGIDAAERLWDILHEHGYTDIFRIAPQQKDWNECLKQRYGVEYLSAVPHERRELYLQSAVELNEMKINPNRIAADLIATYNSADRIRLAEFSVAASEHFLKIAGEDFPLEKMKNRLVNEYKAYHDKGSTSVKLGKLQNAMTTGLEQLRKPSQTAAELKITARKLYDIADHALRLAAEETLDIRKEQKETSEESPSDEPQYSQVMSC